jgi:hypothetical protein
LFLGRERAEKRCACRQAHDEPLELIVHAAVAEGEVLLGFLVQRYVVVSHLQVYFRHVAERASELENGQESHNPEGPW